MHSLLTKVAPTIFAGSILRRFLTLPATAAFGLVALALCGTAAADTLNPGSTLTISFTAQSNQSNLLIFGSGYGMTANGSPVVNIDLFNGNVLLGQISSPVVSFFSEQYFDGFFTKPGSGYTDSSPVPIDFTSINNGKIAGKIELTVTGGSLDYNTNFYLQDAQSCGSGCYNPKGDLSITNYQLSASSPVIASPEPAAASLAGAAAAALFLLRRRTSSHKS